MQSYNAIIILSKTIFYTQKDTKPMILDTIGGFMFKTIKNFFSIIKIGHTLDQFLSADFEFEGESHNFIEIVFVESGSIQMTENEKIYNMYTGDIIVHAPMDFHCLKSTDNTSPHIKNISIIVEGDFPKQIFNGVFHLTKSEQRDFIKYFNLANEYINKTSDYKYLSQQAQSGLTSLILEISAESSPDTAQSTEHSALLYNKLANTMQETVLENLSLTELSKRNNMSVSYAKKLFKHYANTSPKKFYNSLRARAAVKLLEESRSVNYVAEKMNFSSPNYFALFFKTHFDCTPSEYIKN